MLIAIHLEDLVGEAGHRVSAVAHDAASALDAAARHRPDIAIMDLRLAHGTSGIDVARQLYEAYGTRCLFISGNIDDNVRSNVAELRPLGFIGKPFLPAEVISAVQAAASAVESNAR